MKKNDTEARKTVIERHIGEILIGLIALSLLIIFLFQGHSLSKRLSYYDQRLKEQTKLYEDEQERTEEIRAMQEYMKTDEYIESVARERMGLVKENEIVFKEIE